MERSGVRGASSTAAAHRGSNGFVNRRSTVQSGPPAPGSENSVFTVESARAAVDEYLTGTGSARKATAALAWSFRQPVRRLTLAVAAGRITPAEGRERIRAIALEAVAS